MDQLQFLSILLFLCAALGLCQEVTDFREIFEFDGLAPTKFSYRISSSPECELELLVEAFGEVWIGFGLGEQMIGSDVVIASESGIGEYRINSKSQSGIEYVGNDGIAKDGFFGTVDGNTTLQITLSSVNGKRLSLPCNSGNIVFPDSIVLATGNQRAISQHYQREAISINWATGSLDGVTRKEQVRDKVIKIHAYSMIGAFLFAIPLSIFLSSTKAMESWFLFHKGFNVVAVVAALLGTATGIWYVQQVSVHLSLLHHFLGIGVMVALTVNVFLGFWRRKHTKDEEEEIAQDNGLIWRWTHRIFGLAAAFGGIINCVLASNDTWAPRPGLFGSLENKQYEIVVGIAGVAIFLLIVGYFVKIIKIFIHDDTMSISSMEIRDIETNWSPAANNRRRSTRTRNMRNMENKDSKSSGSTSHLWLPPTKERRRTAKFSLGSVSIASSSRTDDDDSEPHRRSQFSDEHYFEEGEEDEEDDNF